MSDDQLTDNQVDISILDCYQKIDFILKVQNELNRQITAKHIEDLTQIDTSKLLEELYKLTEYISLVILGQVKTDSFKV